MLPTPIEPSWVGAWAADGSMLLPPFPLPSAIPLFTVINTGSLLLRNTGWTWDFPLGYIIE